MLEARDLSISWDGGATVVAKGLSFAVEKGRICALLGRSGTGKTTLLHTLAGLIAPAGGEVLVDGRVVNGEPGHVGYMFQKDLLLANKRVIDNVCLPLLLKGTPREEAHAKALPLMERFGLAGTEGSWPAELSGGMRQRAAFLRTYLTGSPIMLLDEPFSALDAITRSELRQWFVKTAEELELTALVITHDVDEALLLANRVLVLAGAPSQGLPSTLAGEVAAREPDETPGAFELSARYLAAKERLLSLL